VLKLAGEGSGVSSYVVALRKYAVFDGRATRKEFWVFALVNLLAFNLLFQADLALDLSFAGGGFGVTSSVFALAVLVPTVAVGARRLHDSGLTALWMLLVLVPFAGSIALLVLLLRSTQPGANEFGPNPFGETVVEFPPDGGPPFALPKGRFVACPWCGRTNPRGESVCQWCHKAYRDTVSELVR
jgi:uncharacterized membrane protein YhaH (DUF805 family)